MTSDLILRRATEPDAGAIALAGAATFLETYAGVLEGSDIVAHCEREHSADRATCAGCKAPRPGPGWSKRPIPRRWSATWSARWSTTVRICRVPDIHPTDFEIRRIYLLSRFQGAGIGRALVERAIADALALGAGRILLGVHSRNERAIGFYQRLGFVTCGKRIFRIGSRDCDDRIMARRIP